MIKKLGKRLIYIFLIKCKNTFPKSPAAPKKNKNKNKKKRGKGENKTKEKYKSKDIWILHSQ